MAVSIRSERQSHRFHSMKLLAGHGGGHMEDVHLNVTPLVDMMMVLVIFLVMNFNANGESHYLKKDMEMALAVNGSEVTRVPIVGVSYNPETKQQQLFFEGEYILDLSQLNVDDQDMRISELEEKLIAERERFLNATSADRTANLRPEEDPTTTVNLQVDKHVGYKLLKRVLYTCELAGYGRIRLTMGDGAKSIDAEAPEESE